MRTEREQKTFVDWIYLNYAWADEMPYAHYGRKNRDFLRQVSEKYDPAGGFSEFAEDRL